jgi:hypothetical protein
MDCGSPAAGASRILGSHLAMSAGALLMAQWPASAWAKLVGKSLPSGLMAPMPVISTLPIIVRLKSQVGQLAAIVFANGGLDVGQHVAEAHFRVAGGVGQLETAAIFDFKQHFHHIQRIQAQFCHLQGRIINRAGSLPLVLIR